MKGITIRITCHDCGEKHDLPLDNSGHYFGDLPCNPKMKIKLQVDPDEWRTAMEEQLLKVKH